MTLALRYNPEPLDFRELIAAATAAPILGLHIDSLTRLCRDRLKMEGKAFMAIGPEGGREQWYLHRSHDPRLADGVDPRQIESDLSTFPERKRAEALQRRECVLRYRRIKNGFYTGLQIEAVRQLAQQLKTEFPGIAISATQLADWHRKYACPADLIRLVDFRGGNHAAKGCAEAWHRFAELYLHQNQPTVKQCWREVRDEAAERGWSWCSYDACARQLDERIAPAEQLKQRDPATYRQQLSPYIAQRVEAWDAGECWIGDHKELDVICRFGNSIVRPWLTAWMDWRTRRIAGWVLSDNPNSTTILGVLCAGLKDEKNYGGPSHIWIDNGRDYDCWMLHGQTKSQRRSRIKPNVDEPRAHGIVSLLGVKAHFSITENPNGKARLERWFGTSQPFCRTYDTYTGNSIETKPERLAEILKLGHLIPTFADVRERLTAHIAGYNARADHDIEDLTEAGEKLSPDEALRRWHASTRIMADPAAMDLLLMHWHRPVPVGRNGVSIRLMGESLHYGQYCPAIERFKGLSKENRKSVVVAYDPDDLSSVKLFDVSGQFLATADMNRIGGFHHGGKLEAATLGELHREKNIYNRHRKIARKQSITQTLTMEEQLAHRQGMKAIEAATPATATPGTIQIIHTPVDGQAAEIEQREQRKAVGDERQPYQRFTYDPLLKFGESARRKLEEEDEENCGMSMRELMGVNEKTLETDYVDPMEQLRAALDRDKAKSPLAKAVEVLNRE